MKCAMCGRKTTWDESYGPKNFIVCPVCFDALLKHIMEETGKDRYNASVEVFKFINKKA